MEKITSIPDFSNYTRTIKQKFIDYQQIDELMSKLGKENSQLKQTLFELEFQQNSLIKSLQNIPDADNTEIREKISDLSVKISEIKNTIEENKDMIRKIWYGYHERC